MTKQASRVSDVFNAGDLEPTDMYISRDQLEDGLVDSLNSDQISLLVGGSGSGKSWLYKKFFDTKNAVFCVLTIPRSYTVPLRALIDKELANLNVGRPTRTRTSINAAGIMGFFGGSKESEQVSRDKDPLLLLAKQLRIKAKNKPAYIVIENAEQGLSDQTESYLNDISNIILSGNADDIKREKVKILIVSADDSLRIRLSKMSNSEPMMRRLKRIGEVTSFSDNEAREFLTRGFEQKLGIKISDMDELLLACRDATDFRPDLLHAFCSMLAKAAAKRGEIVDDPAIAQASEEWSEEMFGSYLERVAEFMNMRDTRKRVRDKILYALSRKPNGSYTTQNVLQIVKDEFTSIEFQTNEITRELNVLCTATDQSAPLLQKFGSDKNPLYGFVGATERLATAFVLGRRGDEIYRKH